ncbi:MarR family winged helix-turn-helix transcriptional regulator [Gracilibacillus alcaliphilus]|uniref:MarR family winged helix-turn-helix transcriptional regulator n=1 Tax=Gracilibacillus alcaliphilus TaxID=1401441 RepID=UPI0019578904|nr:MarR family transcriptional regulator [Gracilibacillus alcaliphilus]MBM7678746.1 DNA-binding MarR family transcriptional regulator [Gracilibacillus alcaliphilus]
MNAGEWQKQELSDAFLGAVYAYMDYEKTTHLLKTKDGKQIYYAEIHIVSAIHDHEGIHVSGLADLLGVTIGAVSQILKKLEKKGLVKKERDARNQSRFLLRLTPDGEVTHFNHLKFHEEFDELFCKALKGGSVEQVAFLKHFLNQIEHRLQKVAKK